MNNGQQVFKTSPIFLFTVEPTLPSNGEYREMLTVFVCV